MGLVPVRPSRDGTTLHRTRDGLFQQVPDPEELSPEEREDMIKLLRWRLDISSH